LLALAAAYVGRAVVGYAVSVVFVATIDSTVEVLATEAVTGKKVGLEGALNILAGNVVVNAVPGRKAQAIASVVKDTVGNIQGGDTPGQALSNALVSNAVGQTAGKAFVPSAVEFGVKTSDNLLKTYDALTSSTVSEVTSKVLGMNAPKSQQIQLPKPVRLPTPPPPPPSPIKRVPVVKQI
jgi:hypothetical protein